jgi:intracellular sulfur oxidation DsrE/DsrF family protein
VNHYLLIESRDPYGTAGVDDHADLAIRLKRAGHEVAVLLVQNGVLPVRAHARRDALARLAESRIDVFADEFSLRERGITPADMPAGVRATPIELVIDRLLAGWQAIWH